MPAILFFLVLFSPVLGEIFLLARKPTKTGAVVRWGFFVLCLSFLVYGFVWRRSFPGHAVRYFMGAGIAQQQVEDHADDFSRSPALPKFQAWAVETLRRFQLGQVSTNGDASYWSLGNVKLAPSEVPDFVKLNWNETGPPEISIGVAEHGLPEFVAVAWYSTGLALGDQTYQLQLSHPHFFKRVSPGVFAYCISK